MAIKEELGEKMIPLKKVTISLLAIIFVGILILSGIKVWQVILHNRSQVIWKTALDKAGQSQPFHYQINIVANSDNKQEYQRIIEGDWNNEKEYKGNYEFRGTSENKKEFVTLDQLTYSKEGLHDNWFVWNTNDYLDAIYYTPGSLIKASQETKFISKKKNLWQFEGIITEPVRTDDSIMGKIKLSVDDTGQLIEAEIQGAMGELIMKKNIIYSKYGQIVTITKPEF